MCKYRKIEIAIFYDITIRNWKETNRHCVCKHVNKYTSTTAITALVGAKNNSFSTRGFLSPHLQRKLHWETFREYVEVPYLRWCRSKRPVQKTRRTNGGCLYRAVFCLHNWGIFCWEVELKGDKRGQNMTKNQVLEGLCNTSFELYNCCLLRCHATKLKVRLWFSLDTCAIPWTIGEISSMESKMSANTRRGSLVKYG